MKTQNTNLAFNKSEIVDLNDAQLENVNGGSGIILKVATWIIDIAQ